MVIAEPPSAAPNESAEGTELKRQLHWAHLKIQGLEEPLPLQPLQKYGPASQNLIHPHLEVQAEGHGGPVPGGFKLERRGPHPGPQERPGDLPRVERVIACAPEQCNCKSSGETMTVIGHDQSEQLDVEPAQYLVLVTKRE